MKKVIIIGLTMLYFQTSYASTFGYSGMTKINDDSYLIVMDKKVYENGNRIGILKIEEYKIPSFTPLQVSDWKHNDGQASDLESVCKIPGVPNEYLLAEAGYWEGKYGRIFHIQLLENSATVKNVYKVPKIIGSKDGVDGDNFEGMICFEKNNQIYVVIGERGGSESYINGYLRTGIYNPLEPSLAWNKHSNQAIEISAPGTWPEPQSKRSISDLYLDETGTIWAVATEDAGDVGPFRSVVYKAAELSNIDDSMPINPIKNKKPSWIVDGFKVESLAAPSNLIPNSFMSIGTEDENYMGVWRPLFHSTH